MPKYDFNCLEWTDSIGLVNRVYNGSLLIINDQIQAFQLERFQDELENNYKYSLEIFNDNKKVLKWNLIQEDRDENRFNCLYLGKHGNSIGHIHKHALHTSILSYNEQTVTRFHCESELINRKGDIVSIERVQKLNRQNPVELIKLPELTRVELITYEKAIQMNLTPIANFPIGYLNDK